MSSGIDDRQASFREPVMVPYCVLHKRHDCWCSRRRQQADALNVTCQLAVGKRVRYNGTNGNEYDKVNHGKPVSGVGLCKEQHDSHGLYILVQHDDGTEVAVDPLEVIIL